MSHAFHDSLPGYHPDQVLHDGCDECEERGRDVSIALTHLDAVHFERAWQRAAQWKRHGLGELSLAEAPLLQILWDVQVLLERRGIPIGVCPTGASIFATAPLIAAADVLWRSVTTEQDRRTSNGYNSLGPEILDAAVAVRETLAALA